MFEKIEKDTYMLFSKGRLCSTIYLIQEGKRRLLVDAGDGKALLDFVPDLCILTHGHFDHTGGVKEDWKRVLLHKDEFGFAGPYIKIPSNAVPNPMKPIRFGSHLLEFIHTPGHTDGSICIFDKSTGVLFSGDTKFAHGAFGRVDVGGSWEKLCQSLQKIERIPYRLLCPGHGDLEERHD
ncbi:MAG: MBL fold metallo-hydrolase [Candidatus Anstonellaceae archaeon]